jgi:hypothetical protein
MYLPPTAEELPQCSRISAGHICHTIKTLIRIAMAVKYGRLKKFATRRVQSQNMHDHCMHDASVTWAIAGMENRSAVQPP